MSAPDKPKVLFFAPILEYPPAGGPQLSVINAIKVLHRISELHIVTTVPRADIASPQAQAFLKNHCHALVHAPTAGWTSGHHFTNRVMRKLMRMARGAAARADVPFVMNYARRNGIELFWIDRVIEHAFGVFHRLRRALPNALIVGDTEAVHSRFVLREVPMIANPLRRALVAGRGRRAEREEAELVNSASAVTAVSDIDADYYRSLARAPSRIHRFSNVVDIDDYEVAPPDSATLKQPRILLLGSYGHVNSPMDRAAKWLGEEIMSLVWKQVPDAHLYIIGRNSDRTQAHLNGPNITVVGQVPSVLAYLKDAAATLVPLKYESGTRFKIVESGAASVACVSTILGAEGLDVTDGQDILIADETESFAAAIVKVLAEPALRASLARGLHDLVVAKYSLDVQTREGSAILAYLGLTDAPASGLSAHPQ
jgi:glycosyltransferase involved in cell wall biosynthesis